MWIAQVRPCKRTQICATCSDDPVHLVGIDDVAYGDGRNASLITDAVTIRCLEHSSIHGTRAARGLSRGNVDDVGSRLMKRLCDCNGVISADAALCPVGCGNPDGH